MDQIKLFKKALKLKVASDRGDEQIRELAKGKYLKFLSENNLNHEDIESFERNNEKILKPFYFMGTRFDSKSHFIEWYENLGFREKLKVAAELQRLDSLNKESRDKYYFNQKP